MQKIQQGEGMTLSLVDIQEKKVGKELYHFQHKAVEQIFDRIEKHPDHINLLFQLPTGGGKTVIFSEFAKRYISQTNKKVLVLTHRIELCKQTSDMLHEFGVSNKIINSDVKTLPDQGQYQCFVAMVETLNNRLNDEMIEIDNLGLVIVDEAHFNSFRKLFHHFENNVILGVTATPLSSNIKLPMHEIYDELIVGESIRSLIEKKVLAKVNYVGYNVKLGSLRIGANGDYTVESSERLYGGDIMQEKLLHAYQEQAHGKKTLIFNNGINTSLEVYRTFLRAGYEVRHLDHSCTEKERREILTWFKNKPDAILSSVSILTTGFDEPTVEAIILNRATRSLTLYHQMIGRGSRVLPDKDEFTVIDLGNNAQRFGLWYDDIDWHDIFKYPELYLDNLRSDDDIERNFVYEMPETTRNRFSKTEDIDFDIRTEHKKAIATGKRSKYVMEKSMDQHATMVAQNAETLDEAYELLALLEDDIDDRIRRYSYVIAKGTDNYLQWLKEDYTRKLKSLIRKRLMEYLQA